MVMMTPVGQLFSPDCLSASLINFGLSAQTARLRRNHSHRQVGLARRCTYGEGGIWCADNERLITPSYKNNCKSRGILDQTGVGYIT